MEYRYAWKNEKKKQLKGHMVQKVLNQSVGYVWVTEFL